MQRRREPFLCGPLCVSRRPEIPVCVTIAPLGALEKSKSTAAGIPVHAAAHTTGYGGESLDTWVWAVLPGAAAREELQFEGIHKADEFSLKVHRCRNMEDASEPYDIPDFLGCAEFKVAEAHIGEEIEYPLKHKDRVVGDVSIRLMADFDGHRPCRSKGEPTTGNDDEVLFDPPRDLSDCQRVLEPLAVRVAKKAGAKQVKSSWSTTLLPPQLEKATKGVMIETEKFRLPPFTGQFSIRFWPRGRSTAHDGNCSVYLWSEEAVIGQIKIYVNEKSELLDQDGPAEWRANGDHGFSDFTQVVKGSVFLRVEVMQALAPAVDEGETIFFAFAPRL